MTNAETTSEAVEPITEEGLLAELRAKNYRNLGMENPEDIDRIEEQLRQEVISPIILARYINVRPQMVYQAIRDGKLTAVDFNNTQKKLSGSTKHSGTRPSTSLGSSFVNSRHCAKSVPPSSE